MADAERIGIELVYALPDRQWLLKLEVAAGTTIEQAIELAQRRADFPAIDFAADRVGVFGKLRSPQTVLVTGDRVEIYRGLIADPKEVRRARVARERKRR